MKLNSNTSEYQKNYQEQLAHYVENGQLQLPKFRFYDQIQINCESPEQLKQIMKEKVIKLRKKSQKLLKDSNRMHKALSLKEVLNMKNHKEEHQSKQDNDQVKDLQNIIKKPSPQKMLKERFTSFKSYMNKNIQTLQGECQKLYGGAQFVLNQLNKHQITKQELVQYYAKMISKNFSLPKLKSISTLSLRDQIKVKKGAFQPTKNVYKKFQLCSDLGDSLSKQSLLKKGQSQNKNSQKYTNKWYINPSQRFKLQKKQTQYDWKKQEGILNVIKTRNKTISNRYKFLPDLIQQVKKKHQRDPIFCKYTSIQ